VVGQPDFNSGMANQGQPGAGPSTLATPTAAAFSGSELFVAEAANHRVIVFPQTGASVGAASFGAATRVLGQDALTWNAPNLIEGREFDFIGSTGGLDGGLAVDLNSNPPTSTSRIRTTTASSASTTSVTCSPARKPTS